MKEPCPACGKWKCSRCGWMRTGASREPNLPSEYSQNCHRCGSTDGVMLDIHHQGWRNEDHKQDARRWKAMPNSNEDLVIHDLNLRLIDTSREPHPIPCSDCGRIYLNGENVTWQVPTTESSGQRIVWSGCCDCWLRRTNLHPQDADPETYEILRGLEHDLPREAKDN